MFIQFLDVTSGLVLLPEKVITHFKKHIIIRPLHSLFYSEINTRVDLEIITDYKCSNKLTI